MALLDVRCVTKRFGAVTAVDGVSLRVDPGEVVGLLGPNGAGKTTTLHMVLGLVTPDAGEVRLFGERLDADRTALLGRLNFAAGALWFFRRMLVAVRHSGGLSRFGE